MKYQSIKNAILPIGILLAVLLVSVSANSTESIKASKVVAMVEAGNAPLILDVRTSDEYASGHVPGAVNITHSELADRLAEITAANDDEIIVYCRSGHRAGIAEAVLGKAGFTNILDMEGHMQGWIASEYPIETPSD